MEIVECFEQNSLVFLKYIVYSKSSSGGSPQSGDTSAGHLALLEVLNTGSSDPAILVSASCW